MKTEQRLRLLLILAFPALFLGLFSDDPSLTDGKNILNFAFLYVLGDTLKQYEYKWKEFGFARILGSWIVLNIILTTLYYFVGRGFRLFYAYCSPLLIFDAVLFFMLFGKMSFQNRFVNNISASVFSIYLIHCQPKILDGVIMPVVKHLYETKSSYPQYVLELAAYTLCIMSICIVTDKLLAPVWTWGNKTVCRIWKACIPQRIAKG